MFVRASLLSLLSLFAGAALGLPLEVEKRASPSIQLDQGTFVGSSDGTTNRFLGIPFGKAPYVIRRSPRPPPEADVHAIGYVG